MNLPKCKFKKPQKKCCFKCTELFNKGKVCYRQRKTVCEQCSGDQNGSCFKQKLSPLSPQNKRVLKWLLRGKRLSVCNSFEAVGVRKINQRIWELRNRGHVIGDLREEIFKNGKRIYKWSIYHITPVERYNSKILEGENLR
jgi:hypothetical protein